MAFRGRVKLNESLLSPDRQTVPAFVRVVERALRETYSPDTGYQFEHDHASLEKETRWNVSASCGKCKGFKVAFRLPARDVTDASVKVTRHSRMLDRLALGCVVVLVVLMAGYFVAMVAGWAPDVSAIAVLFLFVLCVLIGRLVGWFLTNCLFSWMGLTMSAEELNEVGRQVLEAIEAGASGRG